MRRSGLGLWRRKIWSRSSLPTARVIRSRSGIWFRVANHSGVATWGSAACLWPRRVRPIPANPATHPLPQSFRLFYSAALYLECNSIDHPPRLLTRPSGSHTPEDRARGSLGVLALGPSRPPFTTETQWDKPCSTPTVTSFGNSLQATAVPSHSASSALKRRARSYTRPGLRAAASNYNTCPKPSASEGHRSQELEPFAAGPARPV